SGSGHTSDYAYPAAAAAMGVAGTMHSPSATAISSDRGGYSAAAPAAVQTGERRNEFEVDQFDFDPVLDEEMAPPVYGAIETGQRPQRRGMMIAAIVGGVAILGGIGAFAMASGEGDGLGTPAMIKADAGPVKVKPKNPGGTTVPNQDSKVYNSVAGTGAGGDPTQEKLLTSVEEPVELPAPETPVVDSAPAASEPAPANQLAGSAPAPADELPGVATVGKSEDRIEQVLQDTSPDNTVEVAAVAPRKVRTMIVKPDGTLVAREDPTPAVAETPAATASESVKDPVASAPESTGTVPSAAGATFAAPAGDEAAAPETAAAPAAPAPSSSTPSSVPIAPARPSDQPVDIVGEVKGDQVASISPAPTTAAGAWSMQIASQPSEAAAQSSYQDLVSRYGGVLEGRPANIVKAEIAGKGTFWRVRVPAGSRNDAINLCESYKSAGGNCFVSK
ncbi:MAG: SPOR domain-containing protein, partial [Pseudaminobacter sp.]|nr:SPOR domain-containing protein [Pseudaminobacter sp.]